MMREGRDGWLSVMSTNLAIAGVVSLLCLLVGTQAFLLLHISTTLLAGAAGIGLFYVQHQFESAYWARQKAWSFPEAALLGSTHFDLPVVLRWFTANIGVHHVHHLASRIPSYRLGEALAAHPELRDIGRITLRESVQCFRFALWDDESGKLVAFRDLRRSAPPRT